MGIAASVAASTEGPDAPPSALPPSAEPKAPESLEPETELPELTGRPELPEPAVALLPEPELPEREGLAPASSAMPCPALPSEGGNGWGLRSHVESQRAAVTTARLVRSDRPVCLVPISPCT